MFRKTFLLTIALEIPYIKNLYTLQLILTDGGYIWSFHTPLTCKGFKTWKVIPRRRGTTPRWLGFLGPEVLQLKKGTVACQLINREGAIPLCQLARSFKFWLNKNIFIWDSGVHLFLLSLWDPFTAPQHYVMAGTPRCSTTDSSHVGPLPMVACHLYQAYHLEGRRNHRFPITSCVIGTKMEKICSIPTPSLLSPPPQIRNNRPLPEAFLRDNCLVLFFAKLSWRAG